MNGRDERILKQEIEMEKKLKTAPKYLKDFYESMGEKSSLTRSRYMDYVLDMLEFCLKESFPNIEQVRDIKVDSLEDYMEYLSNKKDGTAMGPSIRASRWSAINAFYKFLIAENYISENIFEKSLPRPRVKYDGRREFLSDEEIRQMIKNIDREASTLYKHRDKAIILLLLTSGLKTSTLIEINLEDIDYRNRAIRIVGEDGQIKLISQPEIVMNEIIDWLKDREKMIRNQEDTTDALFISSVRKRITTTGVLKIVKKYTVTIKDGINPSILRNTCAVNMFKNTGELLDNYARTSFLGTNEGILNERFINLEAEKIGGSIFFEGKTKDLWNGIINKCNKEEQDFLFNILKGHAIKVSDQESDKEVTYCYKNIQRLEAEDFEVDLTVLVRSIRGLESNNSKLFLNKRARDIISGYLEIMNSKWKNRIVCDAVEYCSEIWIDSDGEMMASFGTEKEWISLGDIYFQNGEFYLKNKKGENRFYIRKDCIEYTMDRKYWYHKID